MFYCRSNLLKNKLWLSSASEEYCQVHIFFFFTLNSEHLVLKKRTFASNDECSNLAAHLDAQKKYIQSSIEKKCHPLQVDFFVSKMFRSTSYLNKAYLRKKRSFGACHVSIMSYYMSWPHVMMSWPGYNWPQEVSQVRVKLFFAWILMLSPYFRYCFHFRDWIFA